MSVYDEVIRIYHNTESIKETAKQSEVSEGVVRKILIGAGLLTSRLIERIRELRFAGMPQKDIAELLGISTACVNANCGYEKGTYLNENKSVNAERIRASRERKKTGEQS